MAEYGIIAVQQDENENIGKCLVVTLTETQGAYSLEASPVLICMTRAAINVKIKANHLFLTAKFSVNSDRVQIKTGAAVIDSGDNFIKSKADKVIWNNLTSLIVDKISPYCEEPITISLVKELNKAITKK